MTQNLKEHLFTMQLHWTGNLGQGTMDYRSYKRDHEYSAAGKPIIPGSSDPAFRGDKSRYNPEELLVASLSSCHMLWYLHLCADAGVVVTDYQDAAQGTMIETEDTGGHFTETVLRPSVKVMSGTDLNLALQLHEKAHHLCFIANSVNFPVICQPTVEVG